MSMPTKSRRSLAAIATAGAVALTAGVIGLQPAQANIGEMPTGWDNFSIRATGFHDLNGDGVFDPGEPLVSGLTLTYEGVGEGNWFNDPEQGDHANWGAVGVDWPRISGPGTMFTMIGPDVNEPGPYLMRFTGGNHCVAGDPYLLVDGEPYEERLTGDPEWEAVHLDEADGSIEDVYVALEGQQLDWFVPHTCERSDVSGVVFHDENGNGVHDEGERTFSDLAVSLDGVSPLGFFDRHYEFAGHSTDLFTSMVTDQKALAVASTATGDDGSFSFTDVSQLRDYAIGGDDYFSDEFTDDDSTEDRVPHRHWAVANIPDECMVSGDRWERLGGGTDGDPFGPLLTARVEARESVYSTDGFWDGSDYERSANSAITEVDIVAGEDVVVDLPLDCEIEEEPVDEDPVVEDPVEDEPVVEDPVVEDPVVPEVPDMSDGGIRVDTGESGVDPAAVAMTGLGAALLIGSAVMYRRRAFL